MNNSINLIDYRSKISTSSHSKKQKYLKIIAISLLFTVSTSSIVFFILIALSPLPELRNQYKKVASALALSNDDIIKQEVVKDRVSNVRGIIDERADFDKVLEHIQSKLVSGVAIDGVIMEKNNLSITVTSKSLLLIDNFLNELTSAELENKFPKVSLKSLKNEENSNAFLLTLTLSTL